MQKMTVASPELVARRDKAGN